MCTPVEFWFWNFVLRFSYSRGLAIDSPLLFWIQVTITASFFSLNWLSVMLVTTASSWSWGAYLPLVSSWVVWCHQSVKGPSVIRDLVCSVPSSSNGCSHAILTTNCWDQTLTGVHKNCPDTSWVESEMKAKGTSLWTVLTYSCFPD